MAEVVIPAELAESVTEMLKTWKPKKEKNKVKPCIGCYHRRPEEDLACAIYSFFCVNSEHKPYWMNPIEGAMDKRL